MPITFHNAPSSDYWPDGIVYDPEGDGTPIESLGVFEHWNNPVDRQYSRNLGTGDGVELVYLKSSTTGINSNKIDNINIAAPNPFSSYTRFTRPDKVARDSYLRIFNSAGQLITHLSFNGTDEIVWNGTDAQNHPVPDGLYIYKASGKNNNSSYYRKSFT